jgi:hypothetical protein
MLLLLLFCEEKDFLSLNHDVKLEGSKVNQSCCNFFYFLKIYLYIYIYIYFWEELFYLLEDFEFG